ncbi:MAG: hypothetical protein SF123_02220 [Chloroflexota bacterium]|nr:hypothetical protein [Chloroflexota bacterium]
MSLFISVLVVACAAATEAPTPIVVTESPRITLTLRQPRAPTTTPAQTMPQPATLTQAAPTDLATALTYFVTPTPLSVVVLPPACYPVADDSMICLGEVRNPLATPIQHVAVRVTISDDRGAAPVIRTALIAQSIIPPGDSAPYHVMLTPTSAAVLVTESVVIRTEPVTDIDRFANLLIENERMTMRGDRYQVAATVYNPGPAAAQDLLAVVTLRGDDGIIAGYRVAHVGSRLSAGERVALRMNVTPQRRSETYTHQLYVEAEWEQGEPRRLE